MVRASEKTILVVEAEPDVRLFLQTVLEDAGFKVITAADGEAGWQLIKERRPDFISLDLMLPKKSGHRLFRDLQADPELKDIPVMIVTAHADDEFGRGEPGDVLNNILQEGPGKYLKKPVQPQDYVRCVQEALGVELDSEVESRIDLKEEVRRLMTEADSETLQAALDALRKQ